MTGNRLHHALQLLPRLGGQVIVAIGTALAVLWGILLGNVAAPPDRRPGFPRTHAVGAVLFALGDPDR